MSNISMNQIFLLNDPDEARQALCKVACAYMDFYEYRMKLSDLEERYDESIEQYDLATWLTGLSAYNGKSEEESASMIDEAYSLLRETTDAFEPLVSNARSACESILRYILHQPADMKRLTLGFDISIPTDRLEAFLQFFFRYLEDEGMGFEEAELYAHEDVKIVDIFTSMDVKFQRFIQVLERVKNIETPKEFF